MRVRVRFAKLGKVRFTSHRDIARVWERAIRRAELPIAYSQGFTPRPRVSFGLALSTGYESLAEYLDIELAAGVAAANAPDHTGGAGPAPEPLVDLDALPARLSAALPAGIDVTSVAVIPDRTESLQQAVTSCSWDLTLVDLTPAAVDEAIARVLAADQLPVTRERKGKPVQDDLRPGVLALERITGPIDRGDCGVLVRAELGAQPRALRPSELLMVMGLADHEGLVRRTHQWMTDGQTRREPLALTVAPRRPEPGAADRKDHHDVRATGRPIPAPVDARCLDAGRTDSHPGAHDGLGSRPAGVGATG